MHGFVQHAESDPAHRHPGYAALGSLHMPLPLPRLPWAVDMIHVAGLTLAGRRESEYQLQRTACWLEVLLRFFALRPFRL